MKLVPILLIGAATGGAAGFLAGSLTSDSSPESANLTAAELPDAKQWDAVLGRLEQLEAERREAALRSAAARGRDAVDDAPDLEQMLSDLLDERFEAAFQDYVARTGMSGPVGGTYSTVDEAIAALQAAGEDWESQSAVMQAASDAGLLDAMIDELERRAEAQPDSENAQLELAMGYLQKVFDSGNSPETGAWAMKLDGTYDRALEINDQSWNARFGKAVSLSNWPAFLGKQNEAIRQFEVLREQQGAQPDKGGFAETYLYLGNLYQQTGQPDKARAVWEEGSSRFPDHSELHGQLYPDRD